MKHFINSVLLFVEGAFEIRCLRNKSLAEWHTSYGPTNRITIICYSSSPALQPFMRFGLLFPPFYCLPVWTLIYRRADFYPSF
jgi:hypothetical protein